MSNITLTAATLTQATAGGTVAVSLTLADAIARTLALTYRYKLTSNDDYLVATTTLASSVAATTSGATITGAWSVNDDYNDAVVGGAFSFEVIAKAAAAKATGTVTFSTGVVDGDTVTIGSEVYEFDSNSSVTSGHIAVTIAVGVSAANAAIALATALNADGNAVVGGLAGSGVVTLTADTAGAAGNAIALAKVSSSAGAITVSGAHLTLGADAETTSFTNSVTATTTDSSTDIPVAPAHQYPLEGDKNGLFPEDLEILEIEGHVEKYGAVAQGNLNWSFAKKVINELITADRWVIQIFRDRNDPTPRALLVLPSIYAKVLGSNEQNLVQKDVPWFVNCAYRNLTDIFKGDTAYQIVNNEVKTTGFHRKTVQSTVIAYLMSYADYVKYKG